MSRTANLHLKGWEVLMWWLGVMLVSLGLLTCLATGLVVLG